MLFTLLLLWALAFILRYKNKTEYLSWLSRYAFCTGCGSFADVLEKNVTPLITKITNSESALVFLSKLFTNLTYAFSYSTVEYTFLIFTILYSGVFKFTSAKQKKTVIGLLLIPTIFSFILYPKTYFPLNDVPSTIFMNMSFWAVPYSIIGCILLLWGYFKEMNFKLKREKLFTLATIIPPTLFSVYACFITLSMNIKNVYAKNEFFVYAALTFCFILSLKYGFWGIKINLEKQHLDETIKAISFGTSIINHSIKNEAIKINICAENLKKTFINNKDAVEDIDIINSSTEHMLNMMTRIQEKTQEIVVYEQIANLKEVIENALIISKPLLIGKNISIKRDYLIDIMIKIDKVHIQDVLCNIIKNAVEAMKDNGKLKICLYKTKNEVLLLIQDNGVGIPKENIAHVFEPFFSTKNRHHNFGLGLSYCFNVMQKHNGTIDILSEENKGTQVILKFPLKRVENLIQSEVSSNGTNKDHYC